MKITLDEFQDNFQYEILKPTDYVETFQCGDEEYRFRFYYPFSNQISLYTRESNRVSFYHSRCLQNSHPILYKEWFSTAHKRNVEWFYRAIVYGFALNNITF